MIILRVISMIISTIIIEKKTFSVTYFKLSFFIEIYIYIFVVEEKTVFSRLTTILWKEKQKCE